MSEPVECDICVIGAGSGGLTVAAGASLLGARTVLIERAHMGGDCLNFGCVPSKALLAAAKAAASGAANRGFGLRGAPPAADFAAVTDHVRAVIAAIAPVDSVARYEALGATVILGTARFAGPREVEVGGRRVRARRIVVATGSRPAVPPVPGLDAVAHFTNETIFTSRVRPEHLLVLGGGPVGVELAQAHRRLGARVTVLQSGRILPRDDPELAAFVARRLRQEGVALREGAKVAAAAAREAGVELTLADGERLAGSHLLVAAGRRPNVEALDLARAGVEYDAKGIKVDAHLRTSNRRVFAVGDVAGNLQFTHLAGHHGGIALRNMLFRLPAKVSAAVPWVTYTEPELAWVGLREEPARERHGPLRILRHAFAENDRAQAERATAGMIKVIADRRGRVLGAGIVGAHAGELILPWVLAVEGRLQLRQLAAVIAPYPTFSEVSKRAAGSFYTPSLFSPRVRRLVRFLLRFA